MGIWLISLLVAGSIIALLILQARSERRRALRHMQGRKPLPDDDFGRQFFPPHHAEIAARLRRILSRHIALDLSRLHPDDKLVEDLRMDSLDSMSTVEFIVDVEKEFRIVIPDAEAEQMHSLRDVVEHVATHFPKETV
jgi:acyl carrier protein